MEEPHSIDWDDVLLRAKLKEYQHPISTASKQGKIEYNHAQTQ